MKKRGISLIVLIVTIIVVIILAAVVLLTLSKNNPIESAKEARFKEDLRTFQDELAMYISKDYTNKAGQRDEKISTSSYNDIKNYIPSFSKKYEGKFVIKNDELVYNEDKLNDEEKIYVSTLNVNKNIKSGAEIVEESPNTFYGKTVNYKTGNENIDNDITEWKIFYSDGNNIFLISSTYLDPNNMPAKNSKKPLNQLDGFAKSVNFNNIYTEYDGSINIADKNMKFFNNDYYIKEYTSNINNIKAVAYMLDTAIWKDFVNNSFAEFAVGGPSLELFLNSYNNVELSTIGTKLASEAVSKIGYKIKKNDDDSGSTFYRELLKTDNSLYVLSQNEGANAMWLASPSAAADYCIMYAAYNGDLDYNGNGHARV